MPFQKTEPINEKIIEEDHTMWLKVWSLDKSFRSDSFVKKGLRGNPSSLIFQRESLNH